MDSQGLWQAVLTELEINLSRANFGMWLRDTFIAEDTGEVIIIGVPSTFYLDWIRSKYHKNIAEVLRKLRPTIREINYKVASKSSPPAVDLGSLLGGNNRPEPVIVTTTQAPEPVAQPVAQPVAANNSYNLNLHAAKESADQAGFQPALNKSLAPTPTNHTPLDPTRLFSNFIVGNSNRLAHAVSQAAAEEPGIKYNPLFIYGGVGLGKTHLAHAIGNEILRQNPTFRITYVSSEVFMNDFVGSIQKNQMEQFKNRYRKTDVLLIDDIQFISGKDGTQEEFFHTFNALHQNKKQIVLTADREPQNIPELEDRLTSRFAWGMVADIQPPDFETRLAILQAKAAERNYNIPLDSLEAIAQLIQSNIRELEGALQRLIIQSQVEELPMTPEMVNRIFSNVAGMSRNRAVNAHRIIQVVSDFFELKPEEVIGSRRYKELVYPRQIVMYLLRHELSFSYPKIGKELGGKDHTTIMHGVEKIEKEIARNTTMQYDLTQLKEKLYQGYG